MCLCLSELSYGVCACVCMHVSFRERGRGVCVHVSLARERVFVCTVFVCVSECVACL